MVSAQKLQHDTSFAQPRLWNPRVAALLSLPLSVAFGAYLHASNWRELSNSRRAKANIIWSWIGGLQFVTYWGAAFLLEGKHTIILVSIGSIPFLLWYVFEATAQITYVTTSVQNDYVNKPFTIPVLIACVAIITYSALLYVAILILGLWEHPL